MGTLKNASLNCQYLSAFLGKLGTRALAFPDHRWSFQQLQYFCVFRGENKQSVTCVCLADMNG